MLVSEQVFKLHVEGGSGGGGGGCHSFISNLIEVINSQKQENHLSINFTCTSHITENTVHVCFRD